MGLSRRIPKFTVLCTAWLLLATLASAFWVRRAERIKRQEVQAELLQDANHLASRLRFARTESQGFLWALSRTREMEEIFKDPALLSLTKRQGRTSAARMAAIPAVAALSSRLEEMSKDLDSQLLFLVDRKGRCIATSDWRGPDPALGYLLPERGYLLDSQAGHFGEAFLVGLHTKALGSYFAVPIWSGSQVVGSLVLQHTAEIWAARIGMGRAPVLVYGPEGVVLFSNQKGWAMTLLPGRAALAPEHCQALFAQPELPPLPLTLMKDRQVTDAEGRTWMVEDVSIFYSPLRLRLLSSTDQLTTLRRTLWVRAALIILMGWVGLRGIERVLGRLTTLKRLSWVDPLTQVLNRRGFDTQAAQEWARAVRFGRPLTVLAIDLDHFKGINDRFGHPAGDLVLKNTASLCKVQLRDMDLVARMGGEEFNILLPETDLDHAQVVAERIRQAVQNLATLWEATSIPTTVSIGMAMRTASDGTLAEVLARADQALYRAKQGGRNRVER